jgi:hypothetical protein
MKLRGALVGVFAAVASALASVAAINRAIDDDKTGEVAGAMQSQSGAKSEGRNPTGFLPRRQQEQERKQARQRQDAEARRAAEEARQVPQPIPPGWGEPKPAEIPHPTYWPIVMSVGITFIFWGIVTSPLISLIGIVLFGVALAGWIGDLRHGNTHD